MTEAAASTPTPAPTPAPAPVGVIETDLFCDACAFNLHTQKVWRDERLGILVCRCPECGKHQAASERTTAASAWLRRLALLGVLIWSMLGIGFVLGTFGLAMGMHAAAEDGLTYNNYETRDGRTVTMNYSSGTGPQYQLVDNFGQAGANVPTDQVIVRRRLVAWLPGGSAPDGRSYAFGRPPELFEAGLVALLLAAAWYACAVVLTSASWFWRPGRRWLWLLLPILSAITVYILIRETGRASSHYWGNVPLVDDVSASLLLTTVAVSNVLVMALGLATGRPLARLLLSVFVPPKARQLLAFLWHCDGKTMPATKSSTLNSPAARS